LSSPVSIRDEYRLILAQRFHFYGRRLALAQSASNCAIRTDRLSRHSSSHPQQPRHHQFLTEDIGNPHLEKHLARMIALMKASPNLGMFKRLFARVFPPPAVYGEFEFSELNDLDVVETELGKNKWHGFLLV